MPFNAPNLLTLFRIVLIPLLVVVYYWPSHWRPLLAMGIFALAGFTDWLDGYLARRLGQTSKFGAFLDPVADKLIVVVSLVLLVADPAIQKAVIDIRLFVVVAIIIIGREIGVSALREWMADSGQRSSVKVSFVGKVKTATQMGAIGTLLYHGWPLFGLPVTRIGEILLYLAGVLTLWSMIIYLRAAWPSLNGEDGKKP